MCPACPGEESFSIPPIPCWWGRDVGVAVAADGAAFSLHFLSPPDRGLTNRDCEDSRLPGMSRSAARLGGEGWLAAVHRSPVHEICPLAPGRREEWKGHSMLFGLLPTRCLLV